VRIQSFDHRAINTQKCFVFMEFFVNAAVALL
jgi:hypothetical protein